MDALLSLVERMDAALDGLMAEWMDCDEVLTDEDYWEAEERLRQRREGWLFH